MFDLPEPRMIVSEHQASVYTCAACHGTTRAAFPDGVTSSVEYGERIKAAAIYLNHQQLIPEDRVADVMNDLFGAALLCPASIVTWGIKKAADLQPFVEHIAARIASARVRHLDETGFRIGGKTQWLHSASTLALTHYRVSEKRGDIPRTLQGGIIVHDHFKPSYTLAGLGHALCKAQPFWLNASNGGFLVSIMRSSFPAGCSTSSNRRSSTAKGRAASKPIVRDLICFAVCATSKKMCCALSKTSLSPSPTIRPSKTSA